MMSVTQSMHFFRQANDLLFFEWDAKLYALALLLSAAAAFISYPLRTPSPLNTSSPHCLIGLMPMHSLSVHLK